MAAGFCTEHSAASRSIGYEEERAPTVSATYGSGGNNQPFVVGLRTYDVCFTSEGTKNVRSNVYETDIARTIDTGAPRTPTMVAWRW